MGYESVWDALADTPAEAENLKSRSTLMRAITERIGELGLTQKEAAPRMQVTQPRVSDLVNGKIDKFSLDTLVNMASALGLRVRLEVDAAPVAGAFGPPPAAAPAEPEAGAEVLVPVPASLAYLFEPLKDSARLSHLRAVAAAMNPAAEELAKRVRAVFNDALTAQKAAREAAAQAAELEWVEARPLVPGEPVFWFHPIGDTAPLAHLREAITAAANPESEEVSKLARAAFNDVIATQAARPTGGEAVTPGRWRACDYPAPGEGMLIVGGISVAVNSAGKRARWVSVENTTAGPLATEIGKQLLANYEAAQAAAEKIVGNVAGQPAESNR